jgi:membrane protease YdiL (CAAX protease family)
MTALPDARRALRETLGVYALVTLVTWLLSRATSVRFLQENLHLAVAALFLGTAIKLAERLPGGLPHYGLSLGGLLTPDDAKEPAPGIHNAAMDLIAALARALPSCFRETGFALAVCAIVFPPFVLGFYLWHEPGHAFELALQPDLGAFVATQLVVVGLPEEAFFRGYVQMRLCDAWSQRVRMLGADVSVPALVVQAALFALMHFLIDLHVVRLAVFFPGLLFGWIAARRHGIGAATVVHALSNWLSDLLVRGFL